jgi:prephenate dehydrogenase
MGGGPLGAALAVALRARAVARAVDLVTTDLEAWGIAFAGRITTASRAGLLAGEPDAVFLAGPAPASEADLGEWARVSPPPLLQDLAALTPAVLAAAARVQRRCPGWLYVGAHPKLAAETTPGPPAETFVGVRVDLCPLAGVAPAALASAERAWRLLGAEPCALSAEEHGRGGARGPGAPPCA